LFTSGIICLQMRIPNNQFPTWATLDQHHMGILTRPASPYRRYRTLPQLLQNINRRGLAE
jgi:hypothetical protein